MTAAATEVEWGVRHAASLNRQTHVDARQDEGDARRWHDALLFSGNGDAEIVTRTSGGDWQTAPAAFSDGQEADRA